MGPKFREIDAVCYPIHLNNCNSKQDQFFRYMFDLSEKEAAELRHIQKNDVIAWYNTYLTQSSPKCRRLAVRVWGCNAELKEANTQVTSVQVIEDLAAFQISSKFYPSFC